jgi:hypothetical protein
MITTTLYLALVFIVAVAVGFVAGRIRAWWKRGGNIIVASRIDIEEGE